MQEQTISQIIGKYKIESINKNNMLYVKVFNLNAKKEWKSQIHYCRFNNEDQRNKYIEDFKKSVQARIDYMNQRKQERKAVQATPDLIGKIFYTSWGYDMTLNDYIKVTEVKNKTVKAVMIGKIVKDDYGRGGGNSTPDINTVTSKPFQLSVRKGYQDKLCLVGQYPFCNDSLRKGSFSECGSIESHYYNTWD